MHMADALLAPAVAATMYAASAVTVGASCTPSGGIRILRKIHVQIKQMSLRPGSQTGLQ